MLECSVLALRIVIVNNVNGTWQSDIYRISRWIYVAAGHERNQITTLSVVLVFSAGGAGFVWEINFQNSYLLFPKHILTMSAQENTQKRPAEDMEKQDVEAKRFKAEEIAPSNTPSLTDHLNAPHRTIPNPVSKMGLVPAIPDLPPSLKMVTGIEADMVARRGFVGEEECGIRGFVGKGKGVRGVIKQRCVSISEGVYNLKN